MGIEEFKELKCGHLVQDARGICYVIIMREQKNDFVVFTAQTLDNNSFHSELLTPTNYQFWHHIKDQF